ncbi:hypothetical protein A1O1_01908 [Capronia coronata CBS 617.96]|uniref:Peptidase S9 prolyl oligopeptidase catalytic domain-containing protein n=1 Tax=Capronia coronata CBS 617.96 TaxID=1182541 RepID=W9YW70_9EURO|nr:uncharacterized protein A1O1_01908 [Capronia coronata CBS 617.96]EXJ93516.1 hypothetical protein A1O1_01908 [Capronia coronata CBS 617.96]
MRHGHCWNLLLCVTLHLGYVAAGISQGVLSADDTLHHGPIAFLSSWDVLGPFRVGTREAVWGADPIEFHGGIQSLISNEEPLYHSPLTRGANVHWSNRTFIPIDTKTSTSVELVVDFPEVDWQFAQNVYGWSALQFQGWLKGRIWNADTGVQKVVLYPDNILELWVNEHHVFGGDFYGFQRAPVVVDLPPGLNNISVRLIRDVRSMGGTLPPVVRASLRADLALVPIDISPQSLVMPDVVGGRFCSPLGSITVRNQADSWIEVRQVSAVLAEHSVVVASDAIRLGPGQSRPVKVSLGSIEGMQEAIHFELQYSLAASGSSQVAFSAPLHHTTNSSLQKITFLHPSGVVSYAMLRPPPTTHGAAKDSVVPVLLMLHGAGVEADGSLARHMFDAAHALPAWILTPSGMTPWSSDDWHIWGFADVEAALLTVPKWIQDAAWAGPGVMAEKVLVAGHSNGGQGTWFFATHQPDRVLGAAAASGYSSIENYVPYAFWDEADPLRTGILQTARSSFRHELLTDNLVGVPIFQQHGSEDDNVPAYHSRLLNTLLAEAGQLVDYSETPGRGHWFTGTMTTPAMLDFYLGCLNGSSSVSSIPAQFSFVVPNSHELGSKYGIVIDQLTTPDRMGRVTVTTSMHDSIPRWHVTTENIRRLHFETATQLGDTPWEVVLGNMSDSFDVGVATKGSSFVKLETNVWAQEIAPEWTNIGQRYGRQRGSLDSIVRSAGPFEIVYCSEKDLPLAIQTSRNFLQYFGADSNISHRSRYEDALKREGNVITLGTGASIPPPYLPSFPIQIGAEWLSLKTKDSNTVSIPLTPGMGGIWLRPLPEQRLELVVWGYDEVGLRQAARLIPTLTGAGQPDFVVLNNETRWKGHSAAPAMGFFDYEWRISPASFLP